MNNRRREGGTHNDDMAEEDAQEGGKVRVVRACEA